MSRTHEVTRLLIEWRAGDAEAADHLFPLVYDELRRRARWQLLRERQGHTLSTTALVHETYLKLVDQTRVAWEDRSHFFGIATRAMRQILVDYARRHQAQKRGGKQQPLPYEEGTVALDEKAELVLAVDQVLDRLGAHNERLGRVVECRFFGGLTEAEAAEVLDVSVRTVRRDWAKAKAWLYRELHPEEA